MTAAERLDRAAVEAAVHDVVARECARADDPGAAVPGADPDDAHGWHPWSPDRDAHPREPGMPVFHPACWRFFRLLDLGWLGDDLLVGFAWDELGTPDLRYVTRVRLPIRAVPHGPRTLALTMRGHLRLLLAPIELAVLGGPRDERETAAIAEAAARTASWRHRHGRLWLDEDQVLVGPDVAVDQERLDARWELPWPPLTAPRLPGARS